MYTVESPLLTSDDNSVQHAFFGRHGGVSEKLYNSLNCGLGSNDAPESVQENRKRVATYFDLPADSLISIHQVHSNLCFSATDVLKEPPEGDGIVTDQPNIILGVLTADCGSLLLRGSKSDGSPVIGAAHSGWGGSIKGIGQATVDKMVELGAELDTIHVAIGPCIGPKSYEVSTDFADPFLEQSEDNEHFFKGTNKEDKLMFDLPGYIASCLARHGVKKIDITGVDTFAEEDNFFSYRRTTHRKEPDYGRQISCIVIKGA